MERSHSSRININIKKNLSELEKTRYQIAQRLKSIDLKIYNKNSQKTNSFKSLFRNINVSQKFLKTIKTRNKTKNIFTTRSSDSREFCHTSECQTLTSNQSIKSNKKKFKINKNFLNEINVRSSNANYNSINSKTIENENHNELLSLSTNNTTNNIYITSRNKYLINNLNSLSHNNINTNINVNNNSGQVLKSSITNKFNITALKRRVSKIMNEDDGIHQLKYGNLIYNNDNIEKNTNIKNKNTLTIKDYNSKIKNKKFKGIKIATNENSLPKNRPINNIQMNKLVINCFRYDNNEFAQKLYNLNEKYFSILEKMKITRSQMLNEKFEKQKKIYTDNDKIPNMSTKNGNKEKEIKKWEKNFILHEYKDKIPEKEYKKFQIINNKNQENKILETSKKLSELLLKMDEDEYEIPNKMTNQFKSTHSSISIKNIERINRLRKIMKTIEDEGELGKNAMKPNKLKSEQKIQESKTLQKIKVLGIPRFIKTQFKPRTIKKYDELANNYFGLPA